MSQFNKYFTDKVLEIANIYNEKHYTDKIIDELVHDYGINSELSDGTPRRYIIMDCCFPRCKKLIVTDIHEFNDIGCSEVNCPSDTWYSICEDHSEQQIRENNVFNYCELCDKKFCIKCCAYNLNHTPGHICAGRTP